MTEQINNELLKLQDELNKFDNAVTKITQAGEVSNSLIENSKELQKSFKQHIEKIESLFSEYMNKTYGHTQEKVSNIFLRFQERLKQEEKALEKYAQLTDENNELLQNFLTKVTEKSAEKLNMLSDETSNNLKEQKEFVQLQMKKFQNELSKMLDSHKQKLQTEQKVLDNYIDLAASTVEVSKYLKSVNFPDKLSEINTKLSDIKEKNENLNSKLEDIYKTANDTNEVSNKILNDNTNKEILSTIQGIEAANKQNDILNNSKKIKSKISGTRFLLVIILIILVAFATFSIIAFNHFAPDFLTNFSK